MIKNRKPQVFFDSDDDEDLNLFCRIEEALQEDSKSTLDIPKMEEERSRLAAQFPGCFVQNQNNEFYDSDEEQEEEKISKNEIKQFHDAFRELQNKIEYVKRKQQEVDRDASWVLKERREIEREKKRIESDRLIAESNLANVELIDLRKKYNELETKYENDKKSWEIEKLQLLNQIEVLKLNSENFNNVSKGKSNKKDSPESEKSIHVNFEMPINENQNKTPNKDPKMIEKKHLTSSNKKKKGIGNINDSNNHNNNHLLKQNKQRPPLHPKYQLDLMFNPGPVLKEESRSSGRKLLRYKNDLSATLFPNGTRKMKYKDCIYIFYSNGDTAQEFQDGARAYRYEETGAIELQLPDKTVLYEYTNGQREAHYKNGDKEITYMNGQKKIIFPNGDFEVYHPSGKVEKFINGQIVKTFEHI
ncbi:T-complex protein 10 [Tritrichomonas foetus]|uniref:T-complex protein 10 n=1 Tax=Tritrichomonas foetus TaxID=1144522 RepID=A0A1J4KSR2_9EUKA|nr:T-complex protein 10 [Tritrichomonas foetus]|eukprot:OHT14329.1 T-complex protein 10 [Tritrichomonas foetus]